MLEESRVVFEYMVFGMDTIGQDTDLGECYNPRRLKRMFEEASASNDSNYKSVQVPCYAMSRFESWKWAPAVCIVGALLLELFVRLYLNSLQI